MKDATPDVVPLLADTASDVQLDDYVTIRFRNALSGEHLDTSMRNLGAYSTIARAFDFLESKISVGRFYGSYVQPVPPSTLSRSPLTTIEPTMYITEAMLCSQPHKHLNLF